MRAYTGAMNSSSRASLTYSPVEFCRKCCASRLRISSSLTQATSVSDDSSSRQNRAPWRMRSTTSSIVGAPLCLITGTEREKFLQQIRVGDIGGLRRLREIFIGGEVGIGIRLDHVDLAVGVHAVVDARAARESQAAVD